MLMRQYFQSFTVSAPILILSLFLLRPPAICFLLLVGAVIRLGVTVRKDTVIRAYAQLYRGIETGCYLNEFSILDNWKDHWHAA
ncbi:MAG: hypothetical protein AB8B87_21915 [Granulosicoccus sp.]